MATAAAPAAPPAPPATAPARRPLFYYGYWIVGVALMAQFVSVGLQTLVGGVFLKPMTEELDWTRTEFTYAQTVGHFLMAFVGFFIGVYVDRYGGRGMMVIGVTIAGVALFMVGAITELWQWVLLRGVLFTVGAALMGGLVVNVTLSKWWVEKRGQMIGFAAIGASLAGMLMPPLMTVVVDEFGWRTGWRVLAVGAWLLVYPAAMLMRRQPEDHGLHPDGNSDEEVRAGAGAAAAAELANSFTRGEALRTPALYLIVFAYGLSGIALGAVILQTIPFLTDEGFDRSTAAGALVLYSIPSGFSKPVWGLMIDRVTPRYLASLSFMFTAVSVILMVVGASAGSVQILTVAYLLFGLAVGGTVPVQEVIWASYFGRAHLGAVRGVAMPFALVLGAGGPLAVSLYFDVVGDYYGAFYALSAFSVLGALVMLLARKPVKPRAPGAPPAPPVAGPPENGGASLRDPAALASGAEAREDGDGVAAGEPERETVAVPSRVPPRDYMAGR